MDSEDILKKMSHFMNVDKQMKIAKRGQREEAEYHEELERNEKQRKKDIEKIRKKYKSD